MADVVVHAVGSHTVFERFDALGWIPSLAESSDLSENRALDAIRTVELFFLALTLGVF